mmetsp:Transcript_27826/g.59834  ORF Transcript_27826/g.59834 Transcript_27826/m.59834 type:complete len:837 (-) Transcript_27826:916-3426(-)
MSSNRDASNAMPSEMAAPSGPLPTVDSGDSLTRSIIPETAQDSSDMSQQRNASHKSLVDDGHTTEMTMGDGDADPNPNETSLHSRAKSVPVVYPSDSLLDKNAQALSKELDDIFDNFDNFGPRGEREVGGESDIFANISNQTIKDPGKEGGPTHLSIVDQGTQLSEDHPVQSSAAAVTNTNKESTSIIDETSSLKPASITTATTPSVIPPTTPTIRRRNSSISRRRHRHIHQMERISETGNEIISTNASSEETKDNYDGLDDVKNEFVEDFFVQGNAVSEQVSSNKNSNIGNSGNNEDLTSQRSERHHHHHESIDIDIAAATATAAATTLPLASTTRRRIRSAGGSTGGSVGGNSSIGSRRSTTGSGTRLRRVRRRRLERSSRSADGSERRDADNDDETERTRRMGGSGSGSNTLVASLDAGMATLRRWVRARRPSFGSNGDTSGAGSSMTTFRLGEEDIFALSHTGSDPRLRVAAAGASSTSSDPNNTNVFDSNNSNGFLYYRPFEVHVHNDMDADSGFYGSDDESGTSSSILLHPLVPSTESSGHDGGGSNEQQSRQRANSEPDRARIVDFFSSVYGSRAIDGGRTQSGTVAVERNGGRRTLRQSLHRSSTMRPAVPTSPIIIEEETDATEQDGGMIGEQPLTVNATESTRLQMSSPLDRGWQARVSALEAPGATGPSLSPLSRNATEVGPAGVLDSATNPNNNPTAINADETLNPSSQSSSDPNFRARTRWMRINRRFRCIITSVAVLFSLLLFFIVIAWVLLTSTYVLSHNKDCDVPLKAYFWMVSLQLVLDIFRADIMKWLCRYRTDSGRRMPPRVVMYNVAYVSVPQLHT